MLRCVAEARDVEEVVVAGQHDPESAAPIELRHRTCPTGEAVVDLGGELDILSAGGRPLRQGCHRSAPRAGDGEPDRAGGFCDARGLAALVRMAGYAEQKGLPIPAGFTQPVTGQAHADHRPGPQVPRLGYSRCLNKRFPRSHMANSMIPRTTRKARSAAVSRRYGRLPGWPGMTRSIPNEVAVPPLPPRLPRRLGAPRGAIPQRPVALRHPTWNEPQAGSMAQAGDQRPHPGAHRPARRGARRTHADDEGGIWVALCYGAATTVRIPQQGITVV